MCWYLINHNTSNIKSKVAQQIARLTRNVSVVGSSPTLINQGLIKGRFPRYPTFARLGDIVDSAFFS